jgi:excisionase family DNA binding protein
MTLENTKLTLKEACEYLKCGRTSMYEFARTGKIPVYRLNSRLYFDRADLDALYVRIQSNEELEAALDEAA